MEEESIPRQNPGMKRWEKEDRMARPWSTRQGTMGKLAAMIVKGDGGQRSIVRLSRMTMDAIVTKRVTKVTQVSPMNDAEWRVSGICRKRRKKRPEPSGILRTAIPGEFVIRAQRPTGDEGRVR